MGIVIDAMVHEDGAKVEAQLVKDDEAAAKTKWMYFYIVAGIVVAVLLLYFCIEAGKAGDGSKGSDPADPAEVGKKETGSEKPHPDSGSKPKRSRRLCSADPGNPFQELVELIET